MQQGQARRRQRHAHQRARATDQQALAQGRQHQPQQRCTQRAAHCHVVVARQRAQQHQVGEVHQRNQQHQHRAGHEQQQHRPRVMSHDGRQVQGAEARLLPVAAHAHVAVHRALARIGLRRHRGDVGAGRQPRQRQSAVAAVIAAAHRHRRRQYHVARPQHRVEGGRQHAHDSVRRAFHPQAAADHAAVTAVTAHPEAVAEHDHGRAVRMILRRIEVASQYRLQIQRGQQPPVHADQRHLRRHVRAGDIHRRARPPQPQRGHAVEVVQVLVFVRRDVAHLTGVADLAQHHQSRWLRYRQGPPQAVLNQRGYRHAGADAERQHAGSQQQETGPTQAGAPRAPDLGEPDVHAPTSTRWPISASSRCSSSWRRRS